MLVNDFGRMMEVSASHLPNAPGPIVSTPSGTSALTTLGLYPITPSTVVSFMINLHLIASTASCIFPGLLTVRRGRLQRSTTALRSVVSIEGLCWEDQAEEGEAEEGEASAASEV